MAGELAALIGRNIRLARKEKNYNQRQLAQEIAKEDAAATNTAVSEWERGVRKPSDRYMPLIANALEREVEWFYRDHGRGETPDLSTGGDEKPPADLEQIKARLEQIHGAISEIRSLLIRAQKDSEDQATHVENGLQRLTTRLDEAIQSPTSQAPDPPATTRANKRRKSA